MPSISLPTFIATWQKATRPERAAAQSHFIDLCRLLGQPTPFEADPTGEFFTFEKGVVTTDGTDGFADVWKHDCFAWEYKGKHKNLETAYQQLLKYREDLDNPPLLVVCDLNRFEVHTNFTGTAKRVYRFSLGDLSSPVPIPPAPVPPMEVLRAVFTNPELLRPGQTTYQVTEDVAGEFALLADSLRRYGSESERAARFLMRLLFCLFAQDIGLLPAHVFTRLVEITRNRSSDFARQVGVLFQTMATGGMFGTDDIPYFDGGLFEDPEAIGLSSDDMDILARACKMDWRSIEPAIFGTLFERGLDPSKRSQLGAHYTSRDDIMLIVEPVLMAPLRREWTALREEARLLAERRNAAREPERGILQSQLEKLLNGFSERIASVRVLDPACGSGNFLYVALRELLGLEKEVAMFATSNGVAAWDLRVSPTQLHGIEINPYAHELAQVVIWIGYIQWMHDNGFLVDSRPILSKLDSVLQQDAILAYDGLGQPVEPPWPEADVIIGNPPFLGNFKMRRELGDEYVRGLFSLYEGWVPAGADLVCYWFEKARALIAARKVKRAGMLATQGIRGGANQRVLKRIKETGDIFWAESDRDWVLNGAAVHVSMVGFDDGAEQRGKLNGKAVAAINPDLTADIDLTVAAVLKENEGISFQGPSPKGSFDIDLDIAQQMLQSPVNVNGRSNADVVRPVANGTDLLRRPRGKWTIDFGLMSMDRASQYEMPFEYVKRHVYPVRSQNRRQVRAEKWWLYGEPGPVIRSALAGLPRYVATPYVSKHRVFVWASPEVLYNNLVIVFARSDDYFMGVLQSRVHELWARRKGTQVREAESGFRYTPTSTFETFPFPWPPGREPEGDARVEAIARAARELVEKRDRWLNPEGATGTELAKRTLTNLYNQRPTWLEIAHRELDKAVFAAYGWPSDLKDEQVLEALLVLNRTRAAS